jgi:chorismate mutase
MLKWFKDKAQKLAANQCKVNIRMGTKTLVMRSNSTYDRILATGRHNDGDVERVRSAQEGLLREIHLGMANGLQVDEIVQVIEEATEDMDMTKGARMPLDNVLDSIAPDAVRKTAGIEYLRLETLMDFDLDLGRGRAAVRWQILTPHSTLSENQTRIALAALQYARILAVHEEITAELFRRVATGAQGLIDGDPALKLDLWQLEDQGLCFQLWPWTMARPEELEGSNTYMATLEQRKKENLGIDLRMSLGEERVLAAASALIPLFALSEVLDENGRALLGKTIRAMNEHLIRSGTLGQLFSDEEALEAAMPVLLGEEG